ncbi:MAG: hypothetical protein Q7J85_01995 [Bacillota bacterium]|nr:hypothetical protein [Bacillota bacterium]
MQRVLTVKTKPWKIALAFLLILLLLFTAGCAQTITEEGTDMAQERSNLNTQKPPIDQFVSNKLETATFAMG